MTVRNSSRPIARVFWATAAPGCRDELLQRFHSSSAALVDSKVGCLKYCKLFASKFWGREL